jgi:hypothetical protein
MDLTPYVSRVENSLAAASAAGDEGTQRAAVALTTALEPAVRLGIMAALADMALEVSDELGDRVVEVRLEGTGIRTVVSILPPGGADDTEAAPTLAAAGGEASRITLRLPEEIKLQAEHAAAAEGISLNTWLVRATQQALGTGGPAGPRRAERTHRVRGWVQA